MPNRSAKRTIQEVYGNSGPPEPSNKSPDRVYERGYSVPSIFSYIDMMIYILCQLGFRDIVNFLSVNLYLYNYMGNYEFWKGYFTRVGDGLYDVVTARLNPIFHPYKLVRNLFGKSNFEKDVPLPMSCISNASKRYLLDVEEKLSGLIFIMALPSQGLYIHLQQRGPNGSANHVNMDSTKLEFTFVTVHRYNRNINRPSLRKDHLIIWNNENGNLIRLPFIDEKKSRTSVQLSSNMSLCRFNLTTMSLNYQYGMHCFVYMNKSPNINLARLLFTVEACGDGKVTLTGLVDKNEYVRTTPMLPTTNYLPVSLASVSLRHVMHYLYINVKGFIN